MDCCLINGVELQERNTEKEQASAYEKCFICDLTDLCFFLSTIRCCSTSSPSPSSSPFSSAIIAQKYEYHLGKNVTLALFKHAHQTCTRMDVARKISNDQIVTLGGTFQPPHKLLDIINAKRRLKIEKNERKRRKEWKIKRTCEKLSAIDGEVQLHAVKLKLNFKSFYSNGVHVCYARGCKCSATTSTPRHLIIYTL